MRHNVQNFLFFLVIAVGFYFLWTYVEKTWFPPKPRPPRAPTAAEKQLALAAVAGVPAIAEAPKPAPKPPDTPKVVKPEQPTLIPFGDENGYLRVLLTTRGGGVQQVVLTRFPEADRLGREVKGTPLYLIPGVPRPRPYYLHEPIPIPDLKPGKVPEGVELAEPSYTVFHYPSPDDKYPDPFLGETNWAAADGYKDEQGNPRPKVLDGGVHEMAFEAELPAPYSVKFRKTFTLAPAEYHIGMRLEVTRVGGERGKGQLRYQLSGPRGLPIEGEWYTSTYRVALIGWNDRKGTPRRQYETAADVAIKRGGEAVPKGENTFKYMAVATQYFTSAVAIDNTAEGGARNPWAYVRATTEMPFDKKAGHDIPYFEDVTVRAASDTLDLAPGEKVEHRYVVYNGPAKVKLLALMEADRGTVDQALVDRYVDALGLKTITDYHSPTWLGAFANTIYWTDLVIAFTNLMHWLLAVIHSVIPDWAMGIVVLTILVRIILLYPSKKMTQMNMRMMEVQKKLAPQFEELKKKYGDDFHGYNRAKMQLMMANGFNPIAPMGGCLLLLLQMPIMMGLYFCLQESVFFRLESFLWIDNLAAPDMTVWWGEKIPYASTPDNIGGMLYLGPYLNVLPILAVVLMIGQQLAMLPPPTDEQSRQQRTMMKFMMFLMPILFYKFAAGLALYFIIGTVWGLAERKLIPKPDVSAPPDKDRQPAEPEPDKPKGLFGRLKEAMKKRMEEMQRQADEQARRQIRNKGESPGGQQGPGGPGQGQGQPRRDDRRDKKKKRRK